MKLSPAMQAGVDNMTPNQRARYWAIQNDWDRFEDEIRDLKIRVSNQFNPGLDGSVQYRTKTR